MTRTKTATMSNAQAGADLTEFSKQLLNVNPFHADRVVQPSRHLADATAVHQQQFDQLKELADTACREDLSIGAVLWGQAGAGKSHLLNRLARWSEQHACFVFLQNLQARSADLPRSLLRATLSILTEGRQDRWHESQLYRFVEAALKVAFQHAGLSTPSTTAAERAYHQWLDRICADNPYRAPLIERETIYNILFKFFTSAYYAKQGAGDGRVARLAVQWLSGDYLDPEHARELGLPRIPGGEDGVALESDEQIKRVLVALCQFADLRRQPFILCFDGVDCLDADQIGALTRFLHSLLDSAFNLVVITSGVQDTLYRWHEDGVIQKGSWNRIAQIELPPLLRVSAVEARQIVEVRLQQFLEPFDTLGPVKDLRHEDRLFPLGQPWYDEFLANKIEFRPRDVINWAREGWARQQGKLREAGAEAWIKHWPGKTTTQKTELSLDELIDAKVGEKIAEHVEDRQAHPDRLAPDADNLAGLVSHLLGQCLEMPDRHRLLQIEQSPAGRAKSKPDFSLVLRYHGATTGVLLLTTGDAATAAAFALKRVAETRQRLTGCVLVTDKRRPLRLGAKGAEYRERIQEKYGPCYREYELPFNEYAALDAVQVVVGMARSGDLEVEHPRGRTHRVTEAEVIASHHRKDRYQAQPLLHLLLGLSDTPAQGKTAAPVQPEQSPESSETVNLSEADFRQVISARLALMPGQSSHELTQFALDSFLRSKRVRLEAAACKERLEAVAKKMAQEGKVSVKPLADGLHIMARSR